jgi:hypothetical protein
MQARIRRACIHTAWESCFHDKALIGLSANYKDVSSYIGWRQEPQTLRITYAVSVPLNGKGDPFPALKLLFRKPFFFFFFWPALENCGGYFIWTIHHGGT